MLLVVGEEFEAVEPEEEALDSLPDWVVGLAFAIEVVVDLPAALVATPAIIEAVMLNMLVG